MKKFLKPLLLILLISALMFIVACNPTIDKDNNGDDINNGDNVTPPIPVDRQKVFDSIYAGLLAGGVENSSRDIRHIDSKYTLIVEDINITIFYEANYDRSRIQDSEILLRVYDEQNARIKAFVYYKDGTLYTEINGQKSKIDNFGGTSTFQTFLSVITTFDLQNFIYGKDFIEQLTNLSFLVETKSIHVLTSGEEKNIEINDVNLDKAKDSFNEMIKNLFGGLDNKFDLLFESFLGFKLSTIANVQIGRLDANKLRFLLSGVEVDDVELEFSGLQSDFISKFRLQFAINTSNDFQKINLTKFDDPSSNNYLPSTQGEYHLTGTLSIPALNETFQTDIKTKISSDDNSKNQIVMSISAGRNKVAGLYYKDEKLYIDIAGLMDSYLLNGIKLGELGFPKIVLDQVNITKEIQAMLGYIQRLVENYQGGDVNVGLGDNAFEIFLTKVQSKGDVITLKVDKELLSSLTGEDTDVSQWIADKLGIDKAIVDAILGDDSLNDAHLLLSYNVKTKNIGIELIGKSTIFKLDLKAQNIDNQGGDLEYPSDFDQTKFNPFVMPQVVTLNLKGAIRMQNENSVNFDKFLGVFLGDVTGVNTPLMLNSQQEKIYFDFDLMQKDGKLYLSGGFKLNEKPILSIHTLYSDPNIFLIDFASLGIKYRIDKSHLADAFKELVGDPNAFDTENIMAIINTLTSGVNIYWNDEDISFTLAPYKDKDGVPIDPMQKIIGISGLIASVNISLAFTDKDLYVDDTEYHTPSLVKLEDKTFDSMYEAYWHEVATVYFGNVSKQFKLSFIGDSAKLITDKYVYVPSAKLLGLDVSYTMNLKDDVNGTKLIDSLRYSQLSLDPSLEHPLPKKLPVVYDDGSFGELSYQIVDFPYLENEIRYLLTGLKMQEYTIIIGKGSIAEVSFKLPIEIINRIIKPEFGKYGDAPIVAKVTIDPFTYTINKAKDNNYNPISTILNLYFGSNLGSDILVKETIENFEWGFNENIIKVEGGRYYIEGFYNRLKVVMEVQILAKIVDKVVLSNEKDGQYTVDSLLKDTYTLPTISNSKTEVRVYFKDGTYRVVAQEGYLSSILPSGCDGYFPIQLNWNHPIADNVTPDETLNPLGLGTTSTATSPFGDNVIGSQNVSIQVVVPSRRVEAMPATQQGVIRYVTDANNIITETIKGPITYSRVNFFGQAAGGFFLFDPYQKDENLRRLPNIMYLDVVQGNQKVNKGYPVQWQASTIIDAYGNILHPSTDEEWMMAVGIIGKGENTQEITVIIHNLSGRYESIEMLDQTGNPITQDANKKFYLTINPYDQWKLPTTFKLKFSTISGIPEQVYKTNWKIDINGITVEITDSFKFPHQGGKFNLTTYVERNDSMGILEQEILLEVTVNQMTVVSGVIGGLVPNVNQNIVLDRYDTQNQISRNLINALRLGIDMIAVNFNQSGSASIMYQVPVLFSNAEDFITALESTSASSFILKGIIYKGTPLEQEVSVTFILDAREVSSLRLTKANKEDVDSGIIKIDNSIEDKKITINLYKPYSLRGQLGDIVVPSVYFNYLLSEVEIYFKNNFNGNYSPKFELSNDFDKQVINGEFGSTTTVSVVLTNLSQGSCKDTFIVTIITKQDELLSNSIQEDVENFNLNGTVKYAEGYPVSSTLSVEYRNSGKIIHNNVKWISTANYGADKNNGTPIIANGQEVTIIDSRLFNMLLGNAISLQTTLSDGTLINKNIRCNPKDIQEKEFSAVATDSNYNVKDGLITIDNVYKVYPFNIDKLPTVITPKSTVKYTALQDITFGTQWLPMDDYKNTDNSFNQDAINRLINYFGTPETRIAYAIIRGHNGESQRVYLSVKVNGLMAPSVSHNTLAIVDNHLTIDPYLVDFGGTLRLPQDITVSFNNMQSTTFGGGLPINYYLNINGQRQQITSIAYDHLGHKIANIDPSATLNLIIVLPDGQEIDFKVNFLSRELSSVKMVNKANNGTALVDAVYFVDPYDSSTYNVPSSATFSFKSGESIELNNIVWSIGESPFALKDGKYRLQINNDTHKGATYIFGSTLSGFGGGVEPQSYSVKVVVLNRALKETYTSLYSFENPIEGRVEDIPSILSNDKFVDKVASDELDMLYHGISQPVLPTIKWSFTDSQITYGGIDNLKVTGSLTYGSVSLEQAQVLISAKKFTFVEIQGIKDKIIDFNPFTLLSVESSFNVMFSVNGENKAFKFYAKDAETDPNYNSGMIIDWGKRNSQESNSVLKTIKFGNTTKNIYIEANGYKYSYLQVNIEKIDFGYGSKGTGVVEVVIDPLNPIIPTTVKAYGKDTQTGAEIDLGQLAISFNKDINNLIIGGGSKNIEAGITMPSGTKQPFTVKVHYLNRTPTGFYTEHLGYSNNGIDKDGKYYYTLRNLSNNVYVDYFTLDPIKDGTYNSSDHTYILPKSIRIDFPTDGSQVIQDALDKLGKFLVFENIDYKLSTPIVLSGSGAIPIKVVMQSYSVNSNVVKNITPLLDLNLTVTDRTVEKTSISEKATYTDDNSIVREYQKAFRVHFIDPYAIALPETVQVTYRGQSNPITYTNVVWNLKEIKEYIDNPEIISGTVDPEAMNTIAKFPVFGTKLEVQFAIKGRQIIQQGEGDGKTPINGGKIYVKQGMDLLSQLPKSLFYKFKVQGEVDISSVPLTFSDNEMSKVNTSKPRVYTGILGTLGSVDNNNISFIIEVIDPVLYSVKVSTSPGGFKIYEKGSYVSDFVSVARDGNNYYIEGKETTLIPNVVIINKNNDIIYIDSIDYDMTKLIATFNCSYEFLSSTDDANLSGDSTASDKGRTRQKMTFTLPIKTYDYTGVDLLPKLKASTVVRELGTIIKAQDMPLAYDDNGNNYNLIWDMSGVDSFKAGTYTAFGYILDTYGTNRGQSLEVVIKTVTASDGQIDIKSSLLTHEYSGNNFEMIATVADFLRQDGTYGPVRFVIEYSSNKVVWSSQQPVDAGTYFVRVKIEDYNVVGERIFTLKINPKTILKEDIAFYKSESQDALVYEYDNKAFVPHIVGLPEGVRYSLAYRINGVLQFEAVNVGQYTIELTIPSQNNFTSLDVTFKADMSIIQKNVTYSIAQSTTYAGVFAHCPISGLPSNLGDITVEYTYTNSSLGLFDSTNPIREVGTYSVVAKINGGHNYNSSTISGNHTITKKELIISVGVVKTEYLDTLLPFNSSATYDGLVGTDNATMLGELICGWTDGTLTNKHMVGNYPLKAMPLAENNNYEIIYIDGEYQILAASEGASVIENVDELNTRINNLQDGDTVRWYLKPGKYGTISIDKNASVAIVGSYSINGINVGEIGVEFDKIIVNKGAVLIDIVKMRARANDSNVIIGDKASAVTVNRSIFYSVDGTYLTGSKAITSNSYFNNKLYMQETQITNYAVGIYMQGGSVDIKNSVFSKNIGAVQVRNGNVTLINNTFSYTKGDAVYISYKQAELNINGNTFIANVVGIKSYAKIAESTEIQNTFRDNAINTKQLI